MILVVFLMFAFVSMVALACLSNFVTMYYHDAICKKLFGHQKLGKLCTVIVVRFTILQSHFWDDSASSMQLAEMQLFAKKLQRLFESP